MRLCYLFLLLVVLFPGMLSADIKVTRGITYGTAKGHKLLLDIYLPEPNAAQSKRPAIVGIHGGGWERGSKTDFAPIATRMAEKGYVVFAINYRLARGGKNLWPAQLDDAQLAVRWVRYHAQKYKVDPNRIAAVGASAGGHIAAMLGNLETREHQVEALRGYSSRANAVVSLAGPADLTKDFRKVPYYGRRTVQDIVDQLLGVPFAAGGKVDVNANAARAASPIYQINEKTVPHLLIHGAKDQVVAVSQARQYFAALKKAKVPSDYLELSTAGHGTKNPISLWRIFQRMERFLEKQLKQPAAAR
ncbi:hypothetical protein NT6N_08900 [Oceaniferula spumae]|uniref:BD-FAE-like domain-containing protein n=1 Tax=Oceaniferula spumae TaxID=2979115 RepID=A0AAT9FIT9_9BACT